MKRGFDALFPDFLEPLSLQVSHVLDEEWNMKSLTILMPTGLGRWLPLLCWLAATSTSTALQSGDCTYEVNPDGTTVTITDYTGSGGVVVIPSVIDSRSVTTLGSMRS